jgi:dTDP-4-dehydrorhamnose reductase
MACFGGEIIALSKRLLVVGGTGFVGGHIAQMAHETGWSVVIAGASVVPAAGEIMRRSVDIGDAMAVHALMQEVRPDVLINTAALADVDRAERERDRARRVNADGASNLAHSCRAAGIRCVYYSTDVVFDGLQDAYREEDPPRPLNFYGASKAEGERRTLEACPDSAVVRVSLVLGFPVEGGNSFLARLRERLLAGQQVPAPADEIRTPIDVLTAAAATLELAESDYRGILHLGATSAVDRYTLAQRLARAMGLRTDLILSEASYPMNDPNFVRAPRHKRGVLDVSRARQMLRTPMLNLDETIERALETLP